MSLKEIGVGYEVSLEWVMEIRLIKKLKIHFQGIIADLDLQSVTTCKYSVAI
jgi:hypothetical protein